MLGNGAGKRHGIVKAHLFQCSVLADARKEALASWRILVQNHFKDAQGRAVCRCFAQSVVYHSFLDEPAFAHFHAVGTEVGNIAFRENRAKSSNRL